MQSQPGNDADSQDVVKMSGSIVAAFCTGEDDADKAKKLKLGVVVLCADNKAYRQLASLLASELKSAGVGRVVLAGKSLDAGFTANDVSWDSEVYLGCNVYDTINALLDGLFGAGPADAGSEAAETGAAS